MGQLGRMLIVAGLAIAGLGILLLWGDRFGLGRLPGDLLWKRKQTTIAFPIMSSVIVSIVLTLLLNLFLRRK